MGKYLREWRKKHGRLVKGWRKILESERAQTPQIEYLGRKLSEMGEKGIKDKRLRFGGKRKAIRAKFVGGGLPSLGKQR